MRNFLVCSVMLMSLFATAQQESKGLTASNGQFIGFLEHRPADYDANPSARYPLIIFLHGIGERGNGTTDLQSITANGIPKTIKAGHPMRFFWNGKWESFIVLSPQLSYNYGNWQNFYVDEMIKYAKKNLRIDENRIILTGLSLGGGGVWGWAGSSAGNAKQLAAIGVSCGVCGWVNYGNIAQGDLPVWAFHAQNDGTVGVGCTTSAIDAINLNNPAVKPYMTIWPDGYHWIWDRVFDTGYAWQNPNIYEWFLGQNNSLAPNKHPVANAGSNINVSAASGTTTLNASGSYDQDGSIVRYVWKQVSGPAQSNISNAVSASSSVNVNGLTTPGTYQFEVKVVDNRADWTTDVVNVNVSWSNNDNNGNSNGNSNGNGNGNSNPSQPPSSKKPPVAVAGSPVTLTLPANSTILYGTGSYDNDGYITSYQWTKVSGPSCTIANPGSANTTISNLSQGTYQFQLQVGDNNGNSNTNTVSVTVNPAAQVNTAPVAVAGNDATITLPTTSIALNGSNSYDANGSIFAYKWTKVDGPQQYQIADPNAVYTTVSNLTSGTYKFQLTVWDNNWVPASAVITVTVNPAPVASRPPVALAGSDITLTLPSNSANVSGSSSYDPGGSILAYKWEKIGGPSQYTIASPASSNTTISNLVQGTYQFQLTVWNNTWAPASAVITVTVNPAPVANKPPVALAGSDITLTLPSNSANVSGSSSYDPGGSILAYKWEKIGGPSQYSIASPASSNTTISNLVQGTYQFRLTVWDNTWVPASATVNITVNAAAASADQAPVAKAGNDVTISGNSVTLNGTGSYDPDGSILAYKWTRISGPSQYSIGNDNAATTTVSNLAQGTYQFQLTVWDNLWVPNSAIVNVTVTGNNNNNNGSPGQYQAPVAKANPDFGVTLPVNSITLNGSGSYSPGGSLNYYKWEKISGPWQYNIVSPNAASTVISNLAAGTYAFRLTVWDNYWVPNSTTVNVLVNQPPVPSTTANINIALPQSSVVLSGSGSYDPDGSLFAFKWEKIDGPSQYYIANANAANTSFSGLTQGTYQLRFTVWDNNWYPTSTLVTVNVQGYGAASAKAVTGVVAEANNNDKTLTATDKPLVYPNPARSTLNVVGNNAATGHAIINIHDASGRLVKTLPFAKFQPVYQQSINVGGLLPGVYHLEVIVGEKRRFTTTFLKN